VGADHDGHRGRVVHEASGGVAKARATARSAGLGRRQRPTRPKSQSRTSSSPRCHASVHAKTKAPAHPPRARDVELPRQGRALLLLAVSGAVQADLGQQQRALPARFCSRAR
jgi:hypothetical protein